MKLGIGVCIFSGAELLKPALMKIRPHVDLIIGNWSQYSNEGVPAPWYLYPLLGQLKKEGLIDVLNEHQFLNSEGGCCLKAQDLDREKFESGRKIALDHGCTHYMSMDCDEFYHTEEFASAKTIVDAHEYTAVRIWDYVGTPRHISHTIIRLHVPFIHRIEYPYCPKNYGILMDQGRTVNAPRIHVISPEIITMHHMTGVRYNETELIRKFQGHSHWKRVGEDARQEFIRHIQNNGDNTRKELPADVWGIEDYWQGEFRALYERTMG